MKRGEVVKKGKDMYNPEQKNRFINTLSSSQSKAYAKGLFTQTSEYEAEIDLDISDFVRLSDFKKCLNRVHYLDDTTRFKYINVLIEYCYYNNNMILDVYNKHGGKQDLYDYMQNDSRIVFTFSEIQDIEKKINELYPDNGWYYNACMYAAYYGFDISKLKDFQYLRKDDVEIHNKKIILRDNRCIDCIDKPLLLKYIIKVIDEECKYNSGNRGFSTYVGKFEDSVFKYGSKISGFDEKRFVSQTTRNFVGATAFAINKKITWRIVHDSGFCAYLNNELISEGKTLSMFLDREYVNKIQQTVFIITCQAKFAHTRKIDDVMDLLKEYEKKIMENGGI